MGLRKGNVLYVVRFILELGYGRRESGDVFYISKFLFATGGLSFIRTGDPCVLSRGPVFPTTVI